MTFSTDAVVLTSGAFADGYRAGMTIPLIGGEPARLIYDTIEQFSMSIDPDGRIELHNTATGERAAAFARAYAVVEMEVLTGIENCPCPEEHEAMDPVEYRMMVIHAMADDARVLLGERAPHPLWC